MEILWDEPKRLANLAKHGLAFADLNETLFDDALVLPSYNKHWSGIGKYIRVVVFVVLGKEAVSVLSMRPLVKTKGSDMPSVKKKGYSAGDLREVSDNPE